MRPFRCKCAKSTLVIGSLKVSWRYAIFSHLFCTQNITEHGRIASHTIYDDVMSVFSGFLRVTSHTVAVMRRLQEGVLAVNLWSLRLQAV